MNRATRHAQWEREREEREDALLEAHRELAAHSDTCADEGPAAFCPNGCGGIPRAPAAPTSREVFLSLAREALDEVEHALDDGETTDWLPLFLSLYEAKRAGRIP